jgi:hypothetical protein
MWGTVGISIETVDGGGLGLGVLGRQTFRYLLRRHSRREDRKPPCRLMALR